MPLQKLLFSSLICCFLIFQLKAQPFVCQANKYLSIRSGNLSVMLEIDIDAISGDVQFIYLSNGNVGVSLNAIGYRSSDNYIYGLDIQTKNLMRINASGGGELVGNIPDLPNQYSYYGADCTPDGKYLILIGTSFGGSIATSQVLVFVDLDNINNPTTTIPLTSSAPFHSTDIAFNPLDGLLYGFDELGNRLYAIDAVTGAVDFKNYESSDVCDAMGAVFFDSFGTFYGYGRDLGALDSRSLFRASTTDGIIEKIASGPSTIGKDACSCPYTVELQKEVFPKSAFPCTTVEYVFTLSNLTDNVQTGVDLVDEFPTGLIFTGGQFNDFGGQVISQNGDSFFEIQGMSIPPGIHEIRISVYIEENVAGIKKNQATLLGLPVQLGTEQLSDDPSTAAYTDSTLLYVQPLFVDLQYDTFTFCNQAELILDATTFGATYEWHDGSSNAIFTATDPGTYAVTVSTECEVVVDSVLVLSQDITLVQEDPLQIDLGESVQLNPLIIANVSYELTWTDPLDNSLSCLNCLKPIATPSATTDYFYFVSSGNSNCDLEGMLKVEVEKNRELYIPNVFSPNNDGSNDAWQIFGRQPFRIVDLKIFSRWGEVVYEMNTEEYFREANTWNGRFKDKSMNPAVFVWQGTFEFLDGFQLKKSGDLTLMR